MPTAKVSRPDHAGVVPVNLKNPFVAGCLAWLVPGWGHYYQGRYHKALIFFLCVMSMFIAGCALGSSSEVGTARNVYFYVRIDRLTLLGYNFPWISADSRFWWLVQAPLGLAAVPSMIQAWQVHSGQPPLFGKLMAPPKLWHNDRKGVAPVLDEIRQKLPLFELGTYLTAIAGLMNLLIIFDAIGGPHANRIEEEEKEKEKKKEE